MCVISSRHIVLAGKPVARSVIGDYWGDHIEMNVKYIEREDLD